MGSDASNGVSRGVGLDGPPVAVEIAHHQVLGQSSARDSSILRSERASAIAKTWFLILNNGVNLTLQQKGEKKPCRQNEHKILQI
jgi:hypothetical protein